MDFLTLLPLIAWIVLSHVLADNVEANRLGHALLSLSAIPLSLGLLRYPAAFYRTFGQLTLSIFIVARKLLGFVFVFAATGLGFGIALTGLFSDIDIFRNPATVFRTLFDAANYQCVHGYTGLWGDVAPHY